MKKILFLAFVLCFIGETALAAGTIKIGLMCPLTGSWESEGREMQQVVDVLADELNGKGGLPGKMVEVITEVVEITAKKKSRKSSPCGTAILL